VMPLRGRTILITRAEDQAGGLRDALAAAGARVVVSPVIAFAEPDDWGPADRAIAQLETYTRLIFTSANAVDRFLDRMDHLGRPRRDLNPLDLMAIGPATGQRLESRGLSVERSTEVSRAESLLDLISLRGRPERERILIPRAEVAREALPGGLRRLGAKVDVVPVYRTVVVPLSEEALGLLSDHAVDLVTFSSPSTVANLLAGIRAIGGAAALTGVTVAAIGEVTAEAARQEGLDPDIVAPRATGADLARAIVSHYTGG